MKTVYQKIQDLVDKLNYYTKLYDEGRPEISDKEWDDLYFELQAYENETGIYLANSPTQKINYAIVNDLQKIKHNHPMLSLGKTKNIEEIKSFIGNRDWIAMLKMDGLTCSLLYENGKLIRAETRGNGEIGEDITHNAMVIPSIPKRISYTDTLIVDGEIICKFNDFKEFEQEYKNPRNFASGSVRLLDSAECEKRNLTFVAWDAIGDMKQNEIENYLFLSAKLEALWHLGFEVANWLYIEDNITITDAIEQLKTFAQERYFPIDGIVFKFDNIFEYESAGRTDHHFRGGLAYKFYDEEYETWLKDIEWTMGRTGVLTPVAIVESVDTGDSIVERASLHNLTVMTETLGIFPFVGQPVKLIKSNMIIPQIIWAEQGVYVHDALIEVPEVCPICGEPVEVIGENESEFLFCSNPMCQGKLINRLDHFCSKKGLDIRGLSKNTLEKLIEWGWVSSITDIFNLKNFADEWKKKPGFGVKSVENILSAIEDSKECNFVNFVTALGIPLIGTATAKELQKQFKSWAEFRNAVSAKFNFYSLDGFGIEMHYAISHFDYAEADILAGEYLNIVVENAESANQNLEGQVIVITGKLNKFKNRGELQALIESAGGKVAGSVSKNTTYLINNDTESSSSKNLTAKKLGVNIISEQDFIKKFLTF